MKNYLLIPVFIFASCYNSSTRHRELNDARNHMYSRAYDKAIKRLIGTIKRNPSLDTAYALLGISYYRTDSIGLAIKNLSIALKLNPNYTEAFFYRGWATGGLAGLEDLNKALLIDSTFAAAYYQRAKIHITIGNPYGAIDDLAFAKSYGYNTELITASRYAAKMELLDYSSALEDANILVEIDSLAPGYTFAKYRCYAKLGRTDLAERAYQKALALGMDTIAHQRVEDAVSPFFPFSAAELKELEEKAVKKSM